MKYITSIVIAFMTVNALACDCDGKTASEYLSTCEHLFIATVEEIKTLSKEDNGFYTNITEVGKLSKPISVIQGDPSNTQSLMNYNEGSSCDKPLVVGERYVICVENSQLPVNFMCGYTHHLYQDPSVFLRQFER